MLFDWWIMFVLWRGCISQTCTASAFCLTPGTEVSPAPLKATKQMKQNLNCMTQMLTDQCTLINCTRNAPDIIFYLLLILFTSCCQFEWQVAEHFRVCLLASTWGCQSLTGILSVCRREVVPRWLDAVCLSWKCAASAGQARRSRDGGWREVLVDLSQSAVWRILHHFISKMKMSRLGSSPQQLESGPAVDFFYFLPFL